MSAAAEESSCKRVRLDAAISQAERAPASLATAVYSAILGANGSEMIQLLKFLVLRCDEKTLEATRDKAIGLNVWRSDVKSPYQTVDWDILNSILSLLGAEDELRKCQLVCRSWAAAQRFANAGWLSVLAASGQIVNERWMRELSHRRIKLVNLPTRLLTVERQNEGLLRAISTISALRELVLTCGIGQADMAALEPCRLVVLRLTRDNRDPWMSTTFDVNWIPDSMRKRLKALELDYVELDSVARLLTSFPKLLALKLHCSSAGTVYKASSQLSESKIVNLQLNCCASLHHAQAAFVQSVLTFARYPALEMLTLGEHSILPLNKEQSEQILNAIKTVRVLSISSSINLQVFSTTTQWPLFTALRAVDLGFMTLEEPQLKAICKALESAPGLIALSGAFIRKTRHEDGKKVARESQWNHLSTALGKLRKLEVLQQVHHNGLRRGFLSALPAQLKRLAIYRFEQTPQAEFTEEVNELKNNSLLPNLHSLDLLSFLPIGDSGNARAAIVSAARPALCVDVEELCHDDARLRVVEELCVCGLKLFEFGIRDEIVW